MLTEERRNLEEARPLKTGEVENAIRGWPQRGTKTHENLCDFSCFFVANESGGGSADFQSAGSQISNRQCVLFDEAAGKFVGVAE